MRMPYPCAFFDPTLPVRGSWRWAWWGFWHQLAFHDGHATTCETCRHFS